MPLYEYQCETCSERTEVVRRFSDPPLTTCESCGGKLRKLISSPAIQFKGSGFYITDYAKGNSGSGKSESSSSESGTSSKAESTAKSETSSETKSEAKSESRTESKSESRTESKSDSGTAKSSS